MGTEEAAQVQWMVLHEKDAFRREALSHWEDCYYIWPWEESGAGFYTDGGDEGGLPKQVM